MNIVTDIETIPSQDAAVKAAFIQDSIDNFKAPSGLSKGQAAKELGVTDEKEIKFTSKDDMIAKWEKHFAPIKAEDVGLENWRKTSFDGAQGEVISVAWCTLDGEVDCIVRKLGESEADMLKTFFDEILSLGASRPFFIGNYIGGFDLKFLFKRAVILGVDPGFELPHYGRHEQHYYDLMQAWEGFNGKASQDSMCAALGINVKSDDLDGSKVWGAVEAGEYERVLTYNKLDVEEARQLYKRFNFIK